MGLGGAQNINLHKGGIKMSGIIGIEVGSVSMDLIIGREYEILYGARDETKNNKVHFKGFLIQETDWFYVLKGLNYSKCFLKIDFATNIFKCWDVSANRILKVRYSSRTGGNVCE